MKRLLMVLSVAILAFPAFVQAQQNEWVSSGTVVSISAEKRTLTLEETAEPAANSRPGTMQSGVIRPFTLPADIKLLANAQPIQLSDIHVGDHVTIRYILDGKNIAKSITVMSRATD